MSAHSGMVACVDHCSRVGRVEAVVALYFSSQAVWNAIKTFPVKCTCFGRINRRILIF